MGNERSVRKTHARVQTVACLAIGMLSGTCEIFQAHISKIGQRLGRRKTGDKRQNIYQKMDRSRKRKAAPGASPETEGSAAKRAKLPVSEKIV